MEIGLIAFPSPDGSASTARMVEGLGFDSLAFADTQNLTPEVWGQLMLAAAATDRIQLGTGVTNPVSRDAAVTASAAIGLQLASGGRAVVGIGRGDSSMAKIGRRPASPAVLDRYLEQLRAYLHGETVDRDGTPSRLEWLDALAIEPVPIEVAATGPRVIEIAARRVDRIAFAVGADPERLVECRKRARRAAEQAGRDPDSLRYGAYVNCVVHPDLAVAREAARGGVSVFAHFSGFRGMDISALPEGVREAARHLRENYDMAHHASAAGPHAQALTEDFIERFAIVGPVEHAQRRFAELADTGIDFIRVVGGSRDMPAAVGPESIQTIAKEIVPQLR